MRDQLFGGGVPDNSVYVGNPGRIIGTVDAFVEKHREAMLTHPVYSVYHDNKSLEEIQREREELRETWGYDV